MAWIGIFLISISSFYLQAQSNPDLIWLGQIVELDFKTEPTQETLEILLQQNRETNGGVRTPDENSIIFYEEKKPQTTVLIIDGVKLGRFENYRQTANGFIQKISGKTEKGSYRDPGLRLNSSGQEITHIRLFVETQKKGKIKLLRSEKKQADQLKLFFQITEQQEKVISSPKKRTNQIEIKASDFDEPSSALASATTHQKNIQAKIRELSSKEVDQFVTVIYPVQYAAPDNLLNLIRNKISVLGTLELNRDNASILITDRAEYARNLLLTLLALDQQIPQVIVEVKILEISSFDTQEIGVDFSYLKQNQQEGVQIQYQNQFLPSQQTNISGVFRDLDSNTLKQFLGDLQLLAQKNKVDILANSTIVVLNNRRASLSSNQGNTYYVLPSLNQSQTLRNNQELHHSDHDGRGLTRRQQFINDETRNFDETNFNNSQDSRTAQFNQQENSKNWSLIRETSNTGVNLVITPQIRNSAEVIMSVQPSYTEIIGYHKESGSPQIATRNVNTEVRLRHGETVIIGGLFRKKQLKQDAGIPVLKEVPLLGHLFSSEVSIEEKNEIVFMLTCYIQY